MGLSLEEACEILEVSKDSPYSSVLKSYKRLALDWFPDKHNNSPVALDKFQKISLAILKLSLPNKDVCDSITVTEMFSLFQQIFFGNEKCSYDTADGSDAWCDEEYESDADFLDGDDYDDDDDEERLVVTEQEAAKNAQALIEEEEREKKKAEKRKAKKKRRKEKKKQEKASEKQQKHNGELSIVETTTIIKSPDVRTQVSSSDSEEDIDPNSAFVAVIANKKKKQLNVNTGSKILEYEKQSEKEDEKGQETSRILRSRKLAIRGNQMANLQHFQEAVNLFSEAIKLDPKDYRFYGNRSYCFDRLGHYQRALKDAEKSISFSPQWPKGHFRKGRALIGLKEYAKAEKCFEEVLRLDKDCEDAKNELIGAKVLQITEMGFSISQAEAAIAQYNSVQSALEVLLSGALNKVEVHRDAGDLDVFVSDGEGDSESDIPVFKPKPIISGSVDQKMDPRNLEGHESLWVGNVAPEVTEKMVTSLFSKYGELRSVRRLPEKFCAFVNYTDKASAGKAMQALQGKELLGVNILIRYPNKPGEMGTVLKKTKTGATVDQAKGKVTGPVNGDECYFWRTTGCMYAESCRYKHIKAHKGIDKSKVYLKPS